ncbi:MAG: hypothetical protein ACREP7_13755 [Lysobacter sp.]
MGISFWLPIVIGSVDTGSSLAQPVAAAAHSKDASKPANNGTLSKNMLYPPDSGSRGTVLARAARMAPLQTLAFALAKLNGGVKSGARATCRLPSSRSDD